MNITIEQIEEYSCRACLSTPEELKAGKKDTNTAEARRFTMYFLFRFTRMTSPEISKHYGNRPDVSTIAFDAIRSRLAYDKETREIVRKFEEQFIKI